MISIGKNVGRRASAVLLVGTILGGWSSPLLAQEADPLAPTQPTQTAPAETAAPLTPAETAPATTAQPATNVIRSISVRGNQRLEPETIRSYANLAPGQEYTAETLDNALRELYATELFADVVIAGADTGNIVITVRENPVINRVILEGNRRIKDDKILPEIRLGPRQLFTRTKVRADVERIIELYKRAGRFAAQVEPKIVELEQNRVDLVFEIYEGDVSKVRRINILGNEQFSDDRLRREMFTREAGGFLGFLRSNDTYDPDRLAADQQKLRAFYLTQGYADFRVVSALAELTPDRRDFVITYVIEEGPRYRFGTIDAESALRDLTTERVMELVNLRSGDWFNAKAVEDAVTRVNEQAGQLGYAFSDVSPAYDRDADNRVMNMIFRVNETPRVYVERIDIQGNTVTRDKVIRREFRLNEGDAFNAQRVARSRDRIQSLGFFQENLEITQAEGSGPDRIVLGVDVEERSTGELSLSAGYSSFERFVVSANIAQRNFMGKGQELNAGVNWSRYSRSVLLGFMEPYLFDRQILFGAQVFRRDLNSFNFIGNQRNTTYKQVSTGGALRLGFPVTEYVSFGTRYQISHENITLDEGTFFTDGECDPAKAGQYLCDEIGTRITSLVGYTALLDNTDAIRATRGQRISFSQDFAGLGGDVRYVRTRVDGTKYWNVGSGFVLSAHLEGGYIHPLQASPGPGRDAIRITDRFFGAQLRGFDIRGIGPRILRIPYDSEGELLTESSRVSEALGGRAYYMGRVELEIPTSSGIRSMGLRPSVFVDAGSLWSLRRPNLNDIIATCIPVAENTTGEAFQILPGGPQTDCGPTTGADGFSRIPGFKEEFLRSSPSPRVAVGFGVNWVSPFGPFRIDIAKAIVTQEGDDTKLFNFNVGTRF